MAVIEKSLIVKKSFRKRTSQHLIISYTKCVHYIQSFFLVVLNSTSQVSDEIDENCSLKSKR